jgi:hypothetical protein
MTKEDGGRISRGCALPSILMRPLPDSESELADILGHCRIEAGQLTLPRVAHRSIQEAGGRDWGPEKRRGGRGRSWHAKTGRCQVRNRQGELSIASICETLRKEQACQPPSFKPFRQGEGAGKTPRSLPCKSLVRCFLFHISSEVLASLQPA